MEFCYFRLYYKAVIIKILWYRHKNWNINQWNKIESPKTNPHAHGHLIFDKGGKNIKWRKDRPLDKLCWENWTAICKRMKLGHFSTLYKRKRINKLKWIKDLNVRPGTVKLLEKNIGRTLFDKNPEQGPLWYTF